MVGRNFLILECRLVILVALAAASVREVEESSSSVGEVGESSSSVRTSTVVAWLCEGEKC